MKRKAAIPFEKIVFDFLRKLPGVVNNEELTELFKEVGYNLKKKEKDTSVKNVKEYFDFTAWLDGRIERRSMAEALRNLE